MALRVVVVTLAAWLLQGDATDGGVTMMPPADEGAGLISDLAGWRGPVHSVTDKMEQQMVQAASGALMSLPQHCHITIFWEQNSSSTFASAAADLREQVWASHRPVQMMILRRRLLQEEATWRRSVCDAYVMVVAEGRELLRHADDPVTSISSRLWNYHGHYIILLLGSLRPTGVAGLAAVSKTANLLMVQSVGSSVLVWTSQLFPRYSPPRLVLSWRSQGSKHERLRFTPKDKDLWSSVLRIATFHHPPSVIFDYDDAGRVVRRLGVDMQLVETLARVRNFTLEFQEISYEERWGYELANGTWVGLVGQVHHEMVDLGTCNLFLETRRAKLLDYSAPYNFERGCFVTPSPKPLLNWKSPMLPFTWSTWVAVGASLALGGALLRLVVAFSTLPEPNDFTNLSFAYLYVLGSLTSRTLPVTPQGPSLRAYVGVMWLAALILATAYSANLVAFLSVTQMSAPINTLRHLADSGLRLGGHAFWKTQFRASVDPIVRSFADRLEDHADIDALFYLVSSGKFALIENRQYLETVAAAHNSRGRSALRIVPQCLMTYSIGLAFPQNSPLADLLNPLILRVVEAGLVERWRRDVADYYRNQSVGSGGGGGDLVLTSRGRVLALTQLQGVFYVLALGCMGAFVVFLLEQLNSPRHAGSRPLAHAKH